MKTNKVILDFTQVNTPDQEVAVMPANLAKKLLMDYAEKLTRSSVEEITDAHREDLRMLVTERGITMEKIVNCSMEFVQERTLINNIKAENWDAYKVVEK